MSEDSDEHDGNSHPEQLSLKGHFTDLGKARKTKPVWVIEGVITSGLTMVIGPSKDAYKTTITMGMAALVAGHKHKALPVDWVPRLKGPALVFEAEADAGELKEMMEDGIGCKVPADESFLIADHPEDFRLDNEESVETMVEWIMDRDPAVVIIDPLVNFHDMDEKEAGHMMQILIPFRRLAKERDMAIIICHHTRKIEEGKLYTSADARGSGAILGLCDNMLVISPGKDKFEVVVDRKGKKGPAWQKAFQLGIWERRGKQGAEALKSMEKLIINSVLHGFTTPEAVAKNLNVALLSVDKWIKSMLQAGYLCRSGKVLCVSPKFNMESAS